MRRGVASPGVLTDLPLSRRSEDEVAVVCGILRIVYRGITAYTIQIDRLINTTTGVLLTVRDIQLGAHGHTVIEPQMVTRMRKVRTANDRGYKTALMACKREKSYQTHRRGGHYILRYDTFE